MNAGTAEMKLAALAFVGGFKGSSRRAGSSIRVARSCEKGG